MKQINWRLVNKTILLGLVAYIVACYFSLPILFVNHDLGRHLVVGKDLLELLSTHEDLHNSVLYKNFFSYTVPEFPYHNHHWLFGIIMYLVFKIASFKGILISSVIIISLALFFTYLRSKLINDRNTAFHTLILFLPIFMFRSEPRPELFSYLFFSIEFYLLTLLQLHRIKQWQTILVLIPLFIIWINTHAYFPFGLLLLLLFYINYALVNKKIWVKNIYFSSLIAVILSLNCNPFGFIGLFEPFFGSNPYLMQIIENLPLVLMNIKFIFNPFYWYESLLVILVTISFFIRPKNSKSQFTFINLALYVITTFAALKINRLTVVMAFALNSIFAENTNHWFTNSSKRKTIVINSISYTILISLIVVCLNIFHYNLFFDEAGFERKVNRPIEFFKATNIKGPIFNNIDIGSYLIFHLFPDIKPFVDGRPESYPANFFDNIYLPIFKDENSWRKTDDQFKFNVIFFYRLDISVGAQAFLVRRTHDPEWVPVYVDSWTIILVRNNKENQSIINKYAIPRRYFKLGSGEF